jgi:amino acid transporter
MAETSVDQLRRNSIGVLDIVFFVVAAAAPMAAVVGGTPPAFAFGNAAGVPGGFILAGLLYLLFSIGFTAMARHVGGAGGFYAYISLGLGNSVGIGGAMIALLAYCAVQVAVIALFSVFTARFANSLGFPLPWQVWGGAVLIIAMMLGKRNIAVSGRIVGICMIAELAILLILDIAIISRGIHHGGVSAAGFRISEVFDHGLGVTMVFVLGSYIGFEATVIFGEEAHDPDRSIPRATYIALGLITAFYAFSTWAIIQYYGADNIGTAAAKSLESLYFNAASDLLGEWAVMAMNVLLITSYFACVLAFHNTLNRYFHALGRVRVFPEVLSRVNRAHGSPYVAGIVQTVLIAAILGVFAAWGADPYGVILSWMTTLGVLALVAVQVLVSIAVVVFFRRTTFDRSILVTQVVPVLATLGLAGAFALICSNLSLLTGSHSPVVMTFPILVALAGLVGFLLALRLKSSNR